MINELKERENWRKASRKYRENHPKYKREFRFNNEQNQILLGSLLGDGCIHSNNEHSYCYIEAHCEEQEDYLLWKNNILKFNVNCYLHSYHQKKIFQINRGNVIFKYYYDLFYPNGKKTVTREILDKLEPLALAVWFMDDGGYNYMNKVLTLSTHCFGLEGNQIIQKYFRERWNINCKIQKIYQRVTNISLNRKEGTYYVLRFNVKETKKLIEIFKFYIIQIPSMIYKIGLDEEEKSKAIITLKKNSKDYYIENKGKILIKQKLWREEHPNQNKDYNQKYYRKNRDRLLKRMKERYHARNS